MCRCVIAVDVKGKHDDDIPLDGGLSPTVYCDLGFPVRDEKNLQFLVVMGTVMNVLHICIQIGDIYIGAVNVLVKKVLFDSCFISIFTPCGADSVVHILYHKK